MGFQLDPFTATIGLTDSLLLWLIATHEDDAIPAYERYWRYYRNPCEAVTITDADGTRTRHLPAQAHGLPTRLRRSEPGCPPKEIVIENDIGWRVQTLVDYIAGRDVTLLSTAPDESRRVEISRVVEALFEANGGPRLLQDVVLLGSVYGHVDLLIRADDTLLTDNGEEEGNESTGLSGQRAPSGPGEGNQPAAALERAIEAAWSGHIRVETVEAPRAIPLLDPQDYRVLDALILRGVRETSEIDAAPMSGESRGAASTIARLLIGRRREGSSGTDIGGMGRQRVTVTEILSADHQQIYEDDTLVVSRVNPWGILPVVHIQNVPEPYSYRGVGEVEPLVPLQDELNTRLSDRANRVTLQSFKMYLGKGIEGFGTHPVRPGQMWMTDNPDATIESFGGDATTPGEDHHIREIRMALDKISAVTPLASGNIQARVGVLSSENALRISLLGILSKTERQRKTYGAGFSRLFELMLELLDRAGIFHTHPEERGIEVIWAPPIPEDQSKRLADAMIKRELGVPQRRVLAELGYESNEASSSTPDSPTPPHPIQPGSALTE